MFSEIESFFHTHILLKLIIIVKIYRGWLQLTFFESQTVYELSFFSCEDVISKHHLYLATFLAAFLGHFLTEMVNVAFLIFILAFFLFFLTVCCFSASEN